MDKFHATEKFKTRGNGQLFPTWYAFGAACSSDMPWGQKTGPNPTDRAKL